MIKVELGAESVQTLEILVAELTDIDMNPLLDEAQAFCLNRIRTRFLREVGPDEVPWVPSFAGLRRRSQGGTGTLYDTGQLFRSIQAAEDTIDNERVISTDVEYVVHLGKWPFMGIGLQDIAPLEKVLARYWEKSIANKLAGGDGLV